MKTNSHRTFSSRLKIAVAGLALAGAIAGGVTATDQAEADAVDTTPIRPPPRAR